MPALYCEPSPVLIVYIINEHRMLDFLISSKQREQTYAHDFNGRDIPVFIVNLSILKLTSVCIIQAHHMC